MLRLYRRDPKTGQRVPWIFKLEDDNKTIVSEQIDDKLWDRMKKDRARAIGGEHIDNEVNPKNETYDPSDPGKKVYVTRKTPTGTERILLSEFDRMFAAWMIEGEVNPIPGTEDLRTTYFTLRKQQEDEGCKNCEASQLLQEYKKRVKRFVEGQS